MIEDIVRVIEDGRNVLLTSPGGTGKSFATRKLAKIFKDKGYNVYCTGTTGVAALNMENKHDIPISTVHKWAGIGTADDTARKLYKSLTYFAKEKWIKTDLLIIDEISMMGATLFEKLDYIGRMVRSERNPANKVKPFGGLRLLIIGDFLQLPPVKDDWVFRSQPWHDLKLKVFIFSKPMRYPDIAWFNMLQNFRKGKVTRDQVRKLEERGVAYANKRFKDDDIKPTILYSKKVDVEEYNKRELDKLKGEEVVFECSDTYFDVERDEEYKIKGTEEFKYTPLYPLSRYKDDKDCKLLKQLADNNIGERIALKVGAQVMLRYNECVELGLINGSRGVVTAINKAHRVVTVKFLNGISLDIQDHGWGNKKGDKAYIRNQIPLILAWSITIHKVQGCTLDYVVVDLGPSVFAYGQAYVALSRSRTLEGLFISSFRASSIRADPIAVSYTEQLERDGVMYECEMEEESEDEYETEDEEEEEVRESAGGNDGPGDILMSYDIHDRADWRKWLLKNHPDKKGNDPEVVRHCQIVLDAGRALGY
jgi:ATP-dependent DNA helicase PIF1